MSLPAYVYARFSTAEQSKGDSLRRQLEGGRKVASEQGWHIIEEITDEGRSAFHGSNRAEGSKLYEFEQRAQAGHFANGAVLVVENLDRLTREGWEAALDLVRDFTKQGVSVSVWQYGLVFKANEPLNMHLAMQIMFNSDYDRKISADKSERLKAAWAKRIEEAQATGKSTKGVLPGWLERDPQSKLPVAVPHRVAVLEEIYLRYSEGLGLPRIVAMLNQRSEPTWGRGKHAGKLWNVATVLKYLTTRTVLGEYQPQERFKKGVKRRPKCAPIADYYPQVISAELYNRVQAVREGRRGIGGANKSQTFRNLFANIARCSECQGTMRITFPAGGRRSYLYCFNYQRGACSNRTYCHYAPIEQAVMQQLPRVFERAFAAKQAKPSSQLALGVSEAERRLALKKQEVEQLVANLGQVFSRTVAQRVADLEQEIEHDEAALEAMRRDVAAELGKPLPREEVQEVSRLYKRVNEGTAEEQFALRARVNTALKGLVDAMECTPEGKTMLVAGGSLGLTFAPDGTCEDTSVLNGRYEGPDGERDWHPDEAA